MADPIKGLIRFGRAVFDRIEQTMTRAADDPLVQAALEADLNLPPGSLDVAEDEDENPRPSLTGIDDYIDKADPSAAQLEIALDAIQTYLRFWTNVIQAAKTEDPSVVVDEVLYRLLETTTVDLIRMEYPTFYGVMRLLRVFEHDVRLVAEDLVNPEVPANLFTEEWWAGWDTAFRRNYLRFRLEQDGAILEDAAATTVPQRQVGYEVFWRSDVILFLPSLLLLLANKKLDLEKLTNSNLDIYYGWELPPRPPPAPCPTPEPAAGAPISEHIASRGSTVRVTVPAGLAESASATLTQFLFHDADDRLGWLFSLRGDVTFAGQTDSKERPLRIGGKIEAPAGLDLLVRFSGPDRLKVVHGNLENPVGAMQLFVRPAESATHGPAFFIPDPTGTRLEIGDFSFSVDVSAEGMKVRAVAHKSAFVLEPGDTDSFVGKALKSKATRVDFDIGLTIDNEHGLYLDGGGRLAMTIPVSGSILRSVQLSLAREAAAPGSEARFEAVASMRFNLGFMVVNVEQIGFTFGIGSTRDKAPSDAHELLGPLLYLRQLGFRHPSGVGILVDAGVVTGGGSLGYDEELEEYSGVVQLQLGRRVSLKAVGLITTKLPDGRRDFSMLLIASVEFKPPLGPFLWVSLAGVGVLVGINRTLDADALRAGLRNRVLDDILFPPDPVANAARLVAAVRGVFPPAADRHVIGISLKLLIGTPPWLTAELALVVEFGGGETRRVALMGQLHVGLRRGAPVKVLELHVDGVGIWDLEHDEFSLDARIYDSRLADATLAGDVAIRKRNREADRYVLISAGGYHPEFPVPAAFPKLDRLRISLVDTKLVKLTLTAYLAFTPNTKQIGAKIDLRVGGSSFSLEATLGFDALFTEDVGFVVDFDLEIKLKFKGRTLCGVDVYGRLTGSEPKHVSGEWSIDLWLTSISRSFDHTFGSERPPAALPPVDPLPALVEALQDARNWAANLPRSGRALVTLRERPGGGQVLLHPLGGLEVRQAVVPLGIRIDRVNGAPLASARRFDITRVTVGGQPVGDPPSVDDLFAAGEFLELDDDERLARPSFETMKSGVAVRGVGLASGAAIASEMDFDDIILGPDGPIIRGTTKGTVTGPAASLAAIFGPAGRSALRTTGPDRFDAAPLGVRVRRQDYVLARTDDLTPADGVPATSFTVARQALDSRRAADPRAARDLQVVAAFHTEAPA